MMCPSWCQVQVRTYKSAFAYCVFFYDPAKRIQHQPRRHHHHNNANRINIIMLYRDKK